MHRRLTLGLAKMLITGGIVFPSRLCAQPGPAEHPSVGTVAVLGGNIVLGGLTAATRAVFERKDPARAFAFGAAGGAVHFAGTYIGAGQSIPSSWAGLAVGAAGTSIVSNAGRGHGLFDEMYLPLGPMRVRFTPRAPRKFRLAINGFETIVLASDLTRRGLRVDWGRTATSGTFVLVAPKKLITIGVGDTVAGLTIGSTVILSAYGQNEEMLRHEMVHVQQQAFTQESWGRPVEESLRAHNRFVKRLPSWIEIGVVTPLLQVADYRAFGRTGGFKELMESEARILQKR
jgi:hypothetical protein